MTLCADDLRLVCLSLLSRVAVPCAVSLSDVSHIIFGPYTDTFAKKTVHDRVDPRWA